MLSGRLAWVTGGGRGIGQAVSQILAREGARVVVSDLSLDSCHETIQVCHPNKCVTLQFELRQSVSTSERSIYHTQAGFKPTKAE